VIAKDTPTPSPLSHEILNSNPYTFLDDAPSRSGPRSRGDDRRTLSAKDLEASRARRRSDRAVVDEAAPDVRDPDELHDVMSPRGWCWKRPRPIRGRVHFGALLADSRATRLIAGPATFWVAAERVTLARAAIPTRASIRRWRAGGAESRARSRRKRSPAWCRDSWAIAGPVTADFRWPRRSPSALQDRHRAGAAGELGQRLRGPSLPPRPGEHHRMVRARTSGAHSSPLLVRLRAELQPVSLRLQSSCFAGSTCNPERSFPDRAACWKRIAQLEGLQIPRGRVGVGGAPRARLRLPKRVARRAFASRARSRGPALSAKAQTTSPVAGTTPPEAPQPARPREPERDRAPSQLRAFATICRGFSKRPGPTQRSRSAKARRRSSTCSPRAARCSSTTCKRRPAVLRTDLDQALWSW